MHATLRTLSFLLSFIVGATGEAQVIINEIHYNPVERPAFATDGTPVYQGTSTPADFTDDVHEFVELHNPTTESVDVSGWRLAGGIEFTFSAGTTITPGGYAVVAKNPARITAVYSLAGVLGPYTGQLGNGGDTVRLLTPSNVTSDTVKYESNFPWAISANRLGAGDDFTLLNSASYQYKGRSLQRVSVSASSNDPANWVAARPASGPTTFADLPTPGAANIVLRTVPKPVVTSLSTTQLTDGAAIIRVGAQVRVLATFSSVADLTGVQVEYFVDNINAWNEVRSTVAMTALGNNQYSATIPGQADRSIMRYRIKADRGEGSEVVSPRADDPAIVPTGLSTREPWHAYFVTPNRTSLKPIYDCFVSTDGQVLSDSVGANIYPFTGLNGLQAIAYNATGNLRRVLASSLITNTYPRELGWPGVTATDRIWNGTVPAVFVENGRVRDVQIRFHGSRYNRRPGRKSYKLLFPDYRLYQSADSVFITDKGDAFMTAHKLHQLAGLPLSDVRYVDWYFNNDGLQTRLEQGEYNGDLLDLYHEKMQRLNPGSVKEETGELYKSVGVILGSGTASLQAGSPSGWEGTYGCGNGWPLTATGGSPAWTELQRFDYTYTLQNHAWKGPKPFRDLTNGMWTARGDTYSAPNPNLTNLRAWMAQNWDVETELTSLAVGNWMCPWDDTTQNYFLWRRASGKWVRLLWDFDSMYGPGSPATSSIYHGEIGDAANNFRGPNYFKDSFIKAYRAEYKQRLWFLNNTLFDPNNLSTLTFKNSGGSDVTFLSSIGGFANTRFDYVNSQVGLGTFYKPVRPVHTGPVSGSVALPGANLTASAYDYRAAFTLAAAPTVSPHTKSKWEIRLSSGNYDDPVFVLVSPSSLTSLPIPFDQLTYGQTYFWRVTYYDALGRPSITSAETSFSYGPTSTTAGNITINEIMAENISAVTNGADRPDYIELKNTTAADIIIDGWKLTDDELVPNKFVFPAGTTIPAGQYLTVWCDSNSASPGLHSGFGLSRQGQRVLLITNGNVVRDAITFGPQAPNAAIGRISDGVGGWTLVNASPGAANSARAFSTATATLKINEWMATPASGDDWFEIHNSGTLPVALAGLWLSDTPGTPKITQIPALSFVEANGCVRFDADGTTRGFNSANFKLGGGGDNIVLSSTNGLTTIDSVSFSAQQPGISEGRFPDGAANIVAFPLSVSPNDNNWLPAPVRINEALSSSVLPLEDYVEIHNPTAAEVDIGHWWLSDDRSEKRKYQFAAGTVIPAGGNLVVNESAFNIGANAFALSSQGDEIVLSAADASGTLTGYRAQVSFGAAADNVAFGYVPTGGAPEFWPQVNRSPGDANGLLLIGPIVINEINYHPPDLSGADNVRDEFVELHNITRSTVDLSGWRLKGGCDYTFSNGTTIAGGGYLLLVAFDPVADPTTLQQFKTALGVPASTAVYGPYAPQLANSAVNVEVAFPFTPASGPVRSVNVDKVEYADFAPWPVNADGAGASLQRISRSVIGNDVANWTGAAPTPGTVNSGQQPLIFPVVFSAHPESKTVNPGTLVTFTATADGTAPLSYQWRKNGDPLPGQTNPSLEFNASESDEGSYDVVVSNAAGPVTSNAALLVVNDPVVITSHPQSQTVNPGTLVTFSVAGTGTGPFTYQWRKNTQPLEGETGTELSFTASEALEGSYDVVVTNVVGSTPSNAAILSVNDPVVISNQPLPHTLNPGTAVTFTVGVTGTGPFTYQWRKGGNPLVGATSADYTIGSPAETDEGSYDVVVSNAFSQATSDAAFLSVNNPVQIATPPVSLVVREGGHATFTVSATGTATLTYQWRRNQQEIPTAVGSTYEIPAVSAGDLGTYDVIVTNVVGSVTSPSATLGFIDWATAAGVYQGLLLGPDATDPAAEPIPGRITATLSKKGRATGKLEYLGRSHRFRAELDVNLNATVQVKRGTELPVSLQLHLNGVDDSLEAVCQDTSAMESRVTAPHIPKRAKLSPAARAGRYTVVLIPGMGRPSEMNAPGFLTLNISKTGAVSWIGKLPDAVTVKGSALLSPQDQVAFYSPLYVARPSFAGHVAGPLAVDANGANGDFAWRKPPQSKGDYWPGGLEAFVDAQGGLWTPPARALPVLDPSGRIFRLEEPQLPDWQNFPVSVTAQGKFVFATTTAEKPALTINRSTGLLSGRFFDPLFGRTRALHGVFRQNANRADGFAPATGQTRAWDVVPD